MGRTNKEAEDTPVRWINYNENIRQILIHDIINRLKRIRNEQRECDCCHEEHDEADFEGLQLK